MKRSTSWHGSLLGEGLKERLPNNINQPGRGILLSRVSRPLTMRRAVLSAKSWVAMAVDNSIPRPEGDPDAGFLPMYFNASPLIVPTDEGEDALCVFTSEGKAIAYLREVEQEALASPALPMPISSR